MPGASEEQVLAYLSFGHGLDLDPRADLLRRPDLAELRAGLVVQIAADKAGVPACSFVIRGLVYGGGVGLQSAVSQYGSSPRPGMNVIAKTMQSSCS